MTGGELFARCLENEGVDCIFGVPGEENIDLLPTLRAALGEGTVSVIDCPVDYAENMKLTAKLGSLVSPI